MILRLKQFHNDVLLEIDSIEVSGDSVTIRLPRRFEMVIYEDRSKLLQEQRDAVNMDEVRRG